MIQYNAAISRCIASNLAAKRAIRPAAAMSRISRSRVNASSSSRPSLRSSWKTLNSTEAGGWRLCVGIGSLEGRSSRFQSHRLTARTRAPMGLAVRVGFEPTEPVKAQRFSRPPDSTALAPHRCLSSVYAQPLPSTSNTCGSSVRHHRGTVDTPSRTIGLGCVLSRRSMLLSVLAGPTASRNLVLGSLANEWPPGLLRLFVYRFVPGKPISSLQDRSEACAFPGGSDAE